MSPKNIKVRKDFITRKRREINFLLIIMASLPQSCYVLNNNDEFNNECESFLFVSDLDTCIKAELSLFQDGSFLYNEMNQYIPYELCPCNKGEWYKNGDTIFLTTFFQNTIDDYLFSLDEIAPDDSIIIFFYSLKAKTPFNDFAFVTKDQMIVLPNNRGRLCIYCSEDTSLMWQLLLGTGIDYNDIASLECGHAYKYYVKDCFPIIMNAEKLLITDSCLFEIGGHRSFRRILVKSKQ